MRALLLVGHGSHYSPDSSEPVYAHAARIRALGAFDEVREAFWKEEPSLRHALDALEAERVWVVPIFISEGYFTRQVVPRELGLTGPVTHRDGRIIHYCPPVGVHPGIDEVILRRASETAPLSPTERARAALVIIGHGTERSKTSGAAVYAATERVRARGLYGSVECGFLDQEPRIERLVAETAADHIVLVPFFISEGWHTKDTIPKALELTGTRTERDGRVIWYAPAVGTHPAVAEIALELAGVRSSAGSGHDVDAQDLTVGPTPHAAPPAARARAALLEWVAAAGSAGAGFLEVLIRRAEDGTFELRHRADAGLALSALEVSTAPAAARAIARTDGQGQYRPLKSAANLRRGWALAGLDAAALWDALGYLYPTAAIHWHQWRTGELRVTSFAEAAGRQTGIYADVKYLQEPDVAVAVQRCCHAQGCLRRPLWFAGPDAGGAEPFASGPGILGSKGEERDPDGRPAASVPCPEPCSLFFTHARELTVAGVAE
ncbi:MAG TPA: CbiX/SirB N-terminal domain-containing protein [Longimicrobiales bacterium]